MSFRDTSRRGSITAESCFSVTIGLEEVRWSRHRSRHAHIGMPALKGIMLACSIVVSKPLWFRRNRVGTVWISGMESDSRKDYAATAGLYTEGESFHQDRGIARSELIFRLSGCWSLALNLIHPFMEVYLLIDILGGLGDAQARRTRMGRCLLSDFRAR